MKIMIIAFMTVSSLIAMEGVGVVESYMSGNQDENKPTHIYQAPKNEPIKLTIIANYEPTNDSCGICFKDKLGEKFKFWPCYTTYWAHESCYIFMNSIEKDYMQNVNNEVTNWLRENSMLTDENRKYLVNNVLKDARERLAVNMLETEEHFMDYIKKYDGGILKLAECYKENIKDWISLYLQIDGTTMKIKRDKMRKNIRSESLKEQDY